NRACVVDPARENRELDVNTGVRAYDRAAVANTAGEAHPAHSKARIREDRTAVVDTAGEGSGGESDSSPSRGNRARVANAAREVGSSFGHNDAAAVGFHRDQPGIYNAAGQRAAGDNDCGISRLNLA